MRIQILATGALVGGLLTASMISIIYLADQLAGLPFAPCDPLLSETTWVIWRYEWPFEEGDHTFEVRCTEGDGTPQIEEMQKSRPNGATGIHSWEENI